MGHLERNAGTGSIKAGDEKKVGLGVARARFLRSSVPEARVVVGRSALMEKR